MKKAMSAAEEMLTPGAREVMDSMPPGCMLTDDNVNIDGTNLPSMFKSCPPDVDPSDCLPTLSNGVNSNPLGNVFAKGPTTIIFKANSDCPDCFYDYPVTADQSACLGFLDGEFSRFDLFIAGSSDDGIYCGNTDGSTPNVAPPDRIEVAEGQTVALLWAGTVVPDTFDLTQFKGFKIACLVDDPYVGGDPYVVLPGAKEAVFVDMPTDGTYIDLLTHDPYVGGDPYVVLP